MRLKFLCGLCVALIGTAFNVQAQEKTAQEVLREQYSKNREQVEEIFKQKIDKIRERTALPEKMRNLLIRQADEMREFDIYTLDRKLEMKIRQMSERDKIKNELKKELYEKEEQAQKAKEAAREREEFLSLGAKKAVEPSKTAEVNSKAKVSESVQKTEAAPVKIEENKAETKKETSSAVEVSIISSEEIQKTDLAPSKKEVAPSVINKEVVEKDMGTGTLTREK